MKEWKEQARSIIQEYVEAKTTSEKIALVEALGDRGMDLAVIEEILNFAVIGAVKKGLK